MDRKNYNSFKSLVSRRIKALSLIQDGDTDEVIQENLDDFANETWLELENRGNRVIKVDDIKSKCLSTAVSIAVHRLIGRLDQQRLSNTGMTGVPYENKDKILPLDIDITSKKSEDQQMVRVTMTRLDERTEKVIRTVFFTDREYLGGLNPKTMTVNKSAIKNLDPMGLGYTTEPSDYEWEKLYVASLEKFRRMFIDTRNNWDEYRHYYLTGETYGENNGEY